MSQFLELQVDIMITLWVRSHGSGKGYSKHQLLEAERRSKNTKIGPVSKARVDAALDDLIGRGHVCEDDLDENAEVLFKITKKGIFWIEDWHRVEKVNGGFLFHRRRDGQIFVDSTYNEVVQRKLKSAAVQVDSIKNADAHFWTKWGAILTGISIFVAIVLAAIF
ncbi:hypothetical protein [Sphingorhabdus contaminans]|uniref:Uncharacterized protein n=1 Tax=Sphingorhabdus contaminans TaxID=1343899 RepID=A0A553WIN8_9SPHN|nr:hypothetical protein [Sphingorhabdus contaminans]TSB04567.1 hypothetical protein FOM92_03890 [Sphingorhabdus contaminans]